MKLLVSECEEACDGFQGEDSLALLPEMVAGTSSLEVLVLDKEGLNGKALCAK